MALIEHGQITTTETKAKYIKTIADKMITTAKKQTLASRRQIHSVFNRKSATNLLVDQLAPQLKNRQSGYTTIIKQGTRRGDNTSLATLKFVDNLSWQKPETAKPKAAKTAKPKKAAAKPAKKATKTANKTEKKS